MLVTRVALISLLLVGQIASAGGISKERIGILGGGPTKADLFLADSDGRNERPLLSTSAVDYNPSFSADGNWIIFTSDRNGSADIYRVHTDGKGLQRLTDSPSFDDQGALSPDGRTLAFVSTRDGGRPNIWLLELGTHRTRELTRSAGGNFRPSWSPDGSWIAFTSDRDEPHGRAGPDRPPPTGSGCCGWELVQSTALYVVRRDGSRLRRLTPVDRFAGSPKWSPDGKHIVYYFDDESLPQVQAKMTPPKSQIVSINIDTGATRILTSGPALKWSPQYIGENRISYLTASNGKHILADTNGWIGHPEDIENPSWSPDGRLVVFARSTWSSGSAPNPILPIVSRDPGFALYRADAMLSYSPDGRQVLFSGSFSGDKALQVMNADGSGHRAIFDTRVLKVGVVSPAWSPDGKVIAFTLGRFGLRNPNAPAQIALIRSDGSDFRVITQGPDNSGYPSFSSDGKRIVFRILGGTQGLRVLSLSDGKIIQLTADHDDFPEWSPHGDRILFTGFRTGDFEIYTIRQDGSDLRQLTNDHGNDAHAMWSPDGRWILFTSSRSGWKDETLLGGARFPQSYGEIFVMRSNGTDLRQLTDNQWEEAPAGWIR